MVGVYLNANDSTGLRRFDETVSEINENGEVIFNERSWGIVVDWRRISAEKEVNSIVDFHVVNAMARSPKNSYAGIFTHYIYSTCNDRQH